MKTFTFIPKLYIIITSPLLIPVVYGTFFGTYLTGRRKEIKKDKKHENVQPIKIDRDFYNTILLIA